METKLKQDFPVMYKMLTVVELLIASELYDALDEIVHYESLCKHLSKITRVCQQNNIAVHVRAIRSKFTKNKIPLYIETHRAKGWLMKK